jgi:hypothetical protein
MKTAVATSHHVADLFVPSGKTVSRIPHAQWQPPNDLPEPNGPSEAPELPPDVIPPEPKEVPEPTPEELPPKGVANRVRLLLVVNQASTAGFTFNGFSNPYPDSRAVTLLVEAPRRLGTQRDPAEAGSHDLEETRYSDR